MLTSAQREIAVDRCLALAVRYHRDKRSSDSPVILAHGVGRIAAWAAEMGASLRESEEFILKPVETELFARFGAEVAPRLFAPCLKAFEDTYTTGRGGD